MSDVKLIDRLKLAEHVIESARRFLVAPVSAKSEQSLFDAYEQYAKRYGHTWKKRRWRSTQGKGEK